MNYTKNLHSYSQCFHDIFALSCSGFSKNGTFVDIGCSTPDHYSNIKLLLELGWNGLGVDLKKDIEKYWSEYKNIKIFCVDIMTSIDTINQKLESMPEIIDYLNIDLDGYPSQYAIENINLNKKFKSITIEHDEYRFGKIYKEAQRKILCKKGYDIVIQTVAEDWYVHPELVEKSFYEKLKFNSSNEYVMTEKNIYLIRNYLGFEGIYKGPYGNI